MKRVISWFAAGAICLMTATPVVLAATSGQAVADGSLNGQFIDLMNHDRADNGLPPLAADPDLTSIAQTWSAVLLRDGSLSHNPDLPGQLPPNWIRYAENVGMGGSPSSLEAAFMASPEHRANILGQYSLVGVGTSVRSSDGTIFVTVDFMAPAPGATTASCTDSNPPNAPSPAAAAGYYVLGSDGGVFSYGKAPFRGSVPGLGIRATAVLMAVTPDQAGYWVLGNDGGVFTFGDARFFGSVPGTGSRAVGVDLKPTPDGGGYWVLGQDGSVFSFGNARYLGSLQGVRAVKLVPTTTGAGYWIVTSTGGVYPFGDAPAEGSPAAQGIAEPTVSMAATATGNGYWVLGADGGIFSFGDATFHGSVPGLGCQSAVGVQLVATDTGGGYYVLSNDGRVFPFGDAPSWGDPFSLHITALDLAVVR